MDNLVFLTRKICSVLLLVLNEINPDRVLNPVRVINNMRNYTAELLPDRTYHVYNRAVGKENLFLNSDNYNYFLTKYEYFITPLCHTFCFCLLPNHFHFLIRLKSYHEIENYYLENTIDQRKLSDFHNSNVQEKEKIVSNYVSLRFSHLFNGYSQAFNKQNGRHGGLFSRPFKKVEVIDKAYLQKLVHYIHSNPIEAKLSRNYTDWNWSSYSNLLADSETFLNRQELIDLFTDKSNFISFHELN